MNITLHYREGGSDRVYQAAIEPRDSLYVVNVAFGRRGATLQTSTKTPQPVDKTTAERIFLKTVNEKKAKGYTEAADGTSYSHTERQYSGLLPQLLNPIEEAEAAKLLGDPDWCLQEKFDGRRMLVKKDGAEICAINRKGVLGGIPSVLVPQIRSLPSDVILDAEAVGDTLHVFDLLLQDETTWMLRPYQERLEALKSLIPGLPNVHLVETATDHKHVLFNRLRAINAEGVVFKRLDAPYLPGRPASGGPALKLKFTTTASLIVARINPKRSVSLRLTASHHGNVTIPANHPMPAIGAVVEVRYLYAFRESGALFQPVYLGERDDLDPSTCTVSQLKWKAEPVE